MRWLLMGLMAAAGCASRVPEAATLPVDGSDQRQASTGPHNGEAPTADDPATAVPTAPEPAERQVAHLEPAPTKSSKAAKAEPAERPLSKEEIETLVRTLLAQELAAREKQQAVTAP
jgi:hypothetical protein